MAQVTAVTAGTAWKAQLVATAATFKGSTATNAYYRLATGTTTANNNLQNNNLATGNAIWTSKGSGATTYVLAA